VGTVDESAIHFQISVSSNGSGQYVGVSKSDGAWQSDYLELEDRTRVHVILQSRG